VCLLRKCIYGLKQWGREWYFRLSSFLKSIGFEICPEEPCLLVKDEVLLFIYVDDILIMSKPSRFMEDFEICWRLNSRSKSSERPNTYWCPVCVHSLLSGISLSKCQYIEEIVRTFSFHERKKVYSLMELNRMHRVNKENWRYSSLDSTKSCQRKKQRSIDEHWGSSCWYLYQKSCTAIVWTF
jgi:hypothetical protein